MRVVIALGLVMLAFVSAGCGGEKTEGMPESDEIIPARIGLGSGEKTELVPKPDEIILAGIHFGLPGFPPEPLSPGDPMGRPVITKILEWLSNSPRVKGDISAIGREPKLVLELRDRSPAVIRAAYNCVVTRRDDEVIEEDCRLAQGEVVFDPGGGREPMRLNSPELATWLRDGWEKDFAWDPSLETEGPGK